MSRYKNPADQRLFDALLDAAANPNSEMYYKGVQHGGAGHRCAFWHGFNGVKRSAMAIPGTQSWICFQAGKEYARRLKRSGAPLPPPGPSPLGLQRGSK